MTRWTSQFLQGKSCNWSALHPRLRDLPAPLSNFIRETIVQQGTVVMFILRLCEFRAARASTPTCTSQNQGQWTLTPASKDVVEYIGGAVLHKLKKHYLRTNKLGSIEALAHLSQAVRFVHEDHTYAQKSLIELKTRGGLIQPVESLTDLMSEWYEHFDSKRSRKPTELRNYDLCLKLAKNPSVIEDILRLFNKICVHHECFKFMERRKAKTGCTGKSKSLRTKLCDKKTL